jgi:hypothetical protein
MLMVPVSPESGFLAHAIRPRPTSQTALRSSDMKRGIHAYPAALASVRCGTDGAASYACDGR